MVTLPLGAKAAYTYVITDTPAAVALDGTVTMASTSELYVTATINDDDDEHIASTAYVKGAYNDAIAAINRQSMEVWSTLDSMGDNLRVNVYTTWDDDSDNAVTPVEVFMAD